MLKHSQATGGDIFLWMDDFYKPRPGTVLKELLSPLIQTLNQKHDTSYKELKRRIAPIAKKYELCAVYLFGSYARNEAADTSDVDILIDRNGSRIRGMFEMGGLYNDLCR